MLGRDEMLGAGSLVPAGGAEVLEAEEHGGLLFDDNTLHPVDVPGEAIWGRAAGDEEGVEEAIRTELDVRDEPTARHSRSIADEICQATAAAMGLPAQIG